jgi:hypothetical protein
LKFENFTDWDEDKQSVFDLDALLAGGNGNGNLNTGTSTTCLEDILQSCTEVRSQTTYIRTISIKISGSSTTATTW